MKTLWILALVLIDYSALSTADSKTQDCTRLWQLEKEAGCPAPPPEFQAPNAYLESHKDYFVEKKKFDSTKCVTQDDVDTLVDSLESKCNQYNSSKEKELNKGGNKDRHITGTCNHECTPCPKNEILQKCTVTSEIQYKINAKD